MRPLLFSPAWAQEKAKQEAAKETQPVAEKSSPAAKSEGGKRAESYVWRAGGVVKEVDPKARILAIHQETVRHDRDLKMKVSENAAEKLSNLKSGDLVNIWIEGQRITDLTVVKQ